MSYKLVVFDFDGTLADSAPWFMRALNQIADKHRFRKVDDDEVDMLRGRSNREIIQYLGVGFWQLPLIARDMRKLSAAAADSIPLFSGVPELLGDIAEIGVIVAIVSSNSETTIRKILGKSAAFVSHYVCGVSLFGKARELDRLRRRLDLVHANVLCIGDEVRDIEAAKKSGLAVGAVTWGYASEQALVAAKPTLFFHSVQSIRETLIVRSPLVREARPRGGG
jgi:phosphoglycolate phosphatase